MKKILQKVFLMVVPFISLLCGVCYADEIDPIMYRDKSPSAGFQELFTENVVPMIIIGVVIVVIVVVAIIILVKSKKEKDKEKNDEE